MATRERGERACRDDDGLLRPSQHHFDRPTEKINLRATRYRLLLLLLLGAEAVPGGERRSVPGKGEELERVAVPDAMSRAETGN